ncbi:hypothetical protein BXU06_06790 [Aquaspirillum sp. LM1]|uniref:NYN domain-containing protein n=1 Tax=Aquaspirillum sp. LM1 TaxID=1938604 RepID=UPI000983DB47|nr:NYN domain-containing protein [Aquaspirillum sp. LM1]AQR64802.1 hypothetical protein BXU06_06790 [Aquaspirillum sp. LM1]
MPKKTALFVDFDNVFLCLKAIDPAMADCFAKRPAEWLKQLEGSDRRFLIRRCYMNPTSFEEYRPYFIYSAFDVVDCPAVTMQGKTLADMHMTIDIVDRLMHPTRFEEFMLFSADSDFTPVLQKLREYDRQTCVVLAGPSSAAYRASADEILSLTRILEEMLPAGGSSQDSPSFPRPEYRQEARPEYRDYRQDYTPRPRLGLNNELMSRDKIEDITKVLLEALNQASHAIPSAKVIEILREKFGADANSWFGFGRPASFFTAINIYEQGVTFSQAAPGYLYLTHKHTPPRELASLGEWLRNPASDPALVALANKVCALTETPPLSPDEFQICFNYIAEQICHGGAGLNELSKNLRDFAKDKEISLSRQDATGILFLLERNGVNLQYSNKPAEALADIYAEAVVRRCSASQWQMNADEHAMLLTWLGASTAPTAAATPEIQA